MIRQMEPWIGPEERAAVDSYLASGGWLTEFDKTKEFARMLQGYVGSQHAFILSNGTVTLFVALRALGIGPGDEVLVPDYTMIATATAVTLTGATPVFVDICRENLCLDLDLAEAAVSSRTRAIMLVSLNGRAPDMERATALAARHHLHLIEDAAQSLGSRWRGRHLGTFGAAGSFSFSAPKIITTGQGGALVTDDPAIAERIARLRDFGRTKSGADFHETIGFNFKFTDLQAVIGIEQMKKLDRRVKRKKAIFRLYADLLSHVSEVAFLPTDLNDVAPWFIDVLTPDPSALGTHMAAKGIGSRPFYPAIHSQPAYGLAGSFPNAEYVSAHGLWLPSSAFLEDEAIHSICAEICAFFGRA